MMLNSKEKIVLKYSAYTLHGQISGSIASNSKTDALETLKAQGCFNITLEKKTRFKKKDFETWIDALETVLAQNITLQESLSILKNSSDKKVQKVTQNVEDNLVAGQRFSDSVESNFEKIPSEYLLVLDVSEDTSSIDQAVNSIHTDIQQKREHRDELNALWGYPLLLLGVLIFATITMLDVVAPSLVKALGSIEDPSFATSTIIKLSGKGAYSFQIVTIFIATITLVYLIGSSPLTPLSIQKVFNPLKTRFELHGLKGRFLPVMLLALRNGINTQDAIALIENLNNRRINISQWLDDGWELHNALFKEGLISLEEQAIVGLAKNETGLVNALEKLVKIREKKTKKNQEKLKRYLGPILIVTLGVLIGLFAFGLLAPLNQLTSGLLK